MKINNNVQPVRKSLHLTQESLAKQIGVSRRTIVSIEKGNYTPSLMLAFQLAQALKTPLTDLFTINEENQT
ncbi:MULTISPECIES: helix-turn-helix transcriptional regulator [Leuconostoc]|nr:MULTISPECIES: helix-turn-helix transcriptional regulator [Leuconostoc]MCT4383239.1 transcriptional regulator [Leuconostoc suionicum]QXC54201.1 transcriptional regulator [Leuconostoc mesenteroides]TGD35852.1 transcriptional regulator [Leuconostoc mesenteroides]